MKTNLSFPCHRASQPFSQVLEAESAGYVRAHPYVWASVASQLLETPISTN